MNHLSNETSPYLLQHKDNPVHWFAWGEAAFEAAREQNKPIFLSIGYSTCYWCHMMEKDSFELEDVAQALNKDFICIKVDREERPDIDAIYMDAVVGLSGQGGWPMSVFLTPDLKPFFGGTFFWREQFLKLLDAVQRTWNMERSNVFEAAERIEKYLAAHETNPPGSITTEDIGRAAAQLLEALDKMHGGFGGAPKFPQSERIGFLLRQGKAELTNAAAFTLNKMAFGGIYDQLGGGFARYATDREWIVPHFEKMLYDNGQLAHAYLEAFQATGDETFRAVGLDTLQYLLRDMRSPEGAFYAAEDAGDAGREGEFYVWGYDELNNLLDETELNILKEQYEISEDGNFEQEQVGGGKIILCLRPNRNWSGRFLEPLKSIKLKLLAARNQRTRPHRDEKILTSWNALAISAFAKAYEVTLEQHYLDAAIAALKFIREKMYIKGRLLRSYASGAAKYHAYLEDHAFLIQALLDVFEQNGDEAHAAWALELQKLQDQLFEDTEGGGYFFSNPDDSSVILRKKSFHDGAEPAGNAIAVKNLLRLSALTGKHEYQIKVEKLFAAAASAVKQFAASCCGILSALDLSQRGLSQLVVAYAQADQGLERFRLERRQRFLPFTQISFVRGESTLAAISGKPPMDGRTTFYVCKNQTCSAPSHDSTSVLHEQGFH